MRAALREFLADLDIILSWRSIDTSDTPLLQHREVTHKRWCRKITGRVGCPESGKGCTQIFHARGLEEVKGWVVMK